MIVGLFFNFFDARNIYNAYCLICKNKILTGEVKANGVLEGVLQTFKQKLDKLSKIKQKLVKNC